MADPPTPPRDDADPTEPVPAPASDPTPPIPEPTSAEPPLAEPPAAPPLAGAATSTAAATPASAPTDGAAVPWDAPVEATGPAPGLEYAPHGARFVAYLLDAVIIFLIDLVLMIPLFIAAIDLARTDSRPDAAQTALFALLGLGLLIVNILYFPAFWASGGQTPGMRPFRLRVVRDRDGSRFGWGTALLRLVGLYVASAVFYLGFIWIFVDKRRRGWHDLIASTVVIKHAGPSR
jgi:uncharacterized RDD family membrane protein YckC